jgi:lipid-A-disaccharide synthase
MAVILPFEETYFRDRGIDATYVGHPLFDTLADQPPDPAGVGAIRDQGQPVLAVLPGSRKHVVEEVLRGQLEIVERLRDRFPHLHAGISVANDQVAAVVDRLLARSGASAATYRRRNADLLSAADLALVASGTATLEVAYHHTPMIVMYNASRWGYRLIGRWFIRTRHLSLVNILAGRELVPEFMPYYTSTAPIAQRAVELLSDPAARRQMSAALADLLDPLVKTGASHNTAEMLLDMIDAGS